MTGGRRLAVIVPTTGAALHLCALSPRPALPHGAAFAEGDYRPLPLSPDYRALAGPEGPLARHLGAPLPPHELRLSGAPDGGRSWEAPVALAHLLLAREWALVQDEADLTLWATGAVDLDLRLLPADYALARKVDLSRGALPAGSVAVLPPGPGREEARAALEEMGVRVLTPDTLAGVADILDAGGAAPVSRRRLPLWPGMAALGAVALAIGAIALFGRGDGITTVSADIPDPVDMPVVETPPDPEPVNPPPEEIAQTEPPGPPEGVTLTLLRPAPGATCRSALFDAARRVAEPVAWIDGAYAPTPLDPTLCGISVSTGGTAPAVTAEPADAFVTAPGPDSARVLFLRDGVRNVVYSFPVSTNGAQDAPIRHELVSSDP